MLECEFHIPISPTPDFLLRVHYLAVSIERFSGLMPEQYRIIVTVGDRTRGDLVALCPWSRHHPIEWRWLADEKFEKWSYAGTAYERYCYDYAARTVVMLDGDVLVTGRLDEVIRDVRATRKFAAVPAYFSPFYIFAEHLEEASPTAWWQRLCDLAHVPLPAFETEHPGWELMRENSPRHVDELRFSPPYPNAGVVIASADTVSRVGERFHSDFELVNSVTRTSLSGQIALTLAIAGLGLEWAPLPLRFNFQNQTRIHDAFPQEAVDIRVLHFLDQSQIHRVTDFRDMEAVARLSARTDLYPVNAFLTGRLAALTPQVTRERSG